MPCRQSRQTYYSPPASCFKPYSRERMQVPSSAEPPWRMLRRIATFAKTARAGRTTNAPRRRAVSLHKLATQTGVTANWSRNFQRSREVGTTSPITGTGVCVRVCAEKSCEMLTPVVALSMPRFCSNRWQPSIHGCDEMSFGSYCGDDDSRCDEELTCEYTHCNVLDMIDIDLSRRREAKNQEMLELLVGLGRDDRRRYNACGKSLEHANSRCGHWCSDPSFFSCPDGEECFTDTNCYAADGTPSSSPITRSPSSSPSTPFPSTSPVESPSESPTTTAPSRLPTTSPAYPSDHPTWRQFCGRDFDHSIQQCRVETHCLDDSSCPYNQRCQKGLPPHCNAYEMLHDTSEHVPTQSPTQRPQDSNASPTREPSRQEEGVVYLDGDVTIKYEDNHWCGANQLAANKNCGTTNFYCVRGLCPFGWSCYHVDNEACGADAATQTNRPFGTKRPVSSPSTANVPSSPAQSENDEYSGFTKPLPDKKNKAPNGGKNDGQPKPFTHAGSRPQSSGKLEPQSSANKILASNKGKRPVGCEAGWHTTADCKSYWLCDAYGKKSKSFVSFMGRGSAVQYVNLISRSLSKSCGQGNAFDSTYNMCIPEEFVDRNKCQFKQAQSNGDENTHQANSNTDDSELLFEFSQGAEEGEDSHVIEASKSPVTIK